MNAGSGAQVFWWPSHARAMTILTFGAALAVALLGSPPMPAQLALLAVGVALLGVPHGALDHLIGRRLLRPRLGGRWPVAFFATYLGLAAAVVAVWWQFPVAALVGFLMISAVHFGLGDVRSELSTPWLFPFEVAARGALPILLPVFLHPAEVTALFAALTGDAAPSTAAVEGSSAAVAALLAPALAWTVAHHSRHRLAGGGHAHGAVLVEITALATVCWLAPPLLAFTIYFCGWHSARHTLETAEALMPGSLRAALANFALLAAPLSAVTVVMAAGAWGLLRVSTPSLQTAPALLQVVFIGLAALTVPHMALCATAQRVGRTAPRAG